MKLTTMTARHDQQAVSGQDQAQQQARLGKYDEEQAQIGPLKDQFGEVRRF